MHNIINNAVLCLGINVDFLSFSIIAISRRDIIVEDTLLKYYLQ